jgi:hypothetical protein
MPLKLATMARQSSCCAKAPRLANKAGEPMVAELMQQLEQLFTRPANPFAHLFDKFTPDELLDIMKDHGNTRREKKTMSSETPTTTHHPSYD